MKKIIVFACALPLAFSACMTMQSVSFSESENVVKVYQDLIGTQDQNYLKANEWMIGIFKDATSVIQHTDKADGVIIGKYLMHGTTQTSQYHSHDSRVYAIIDIRVKEGKARIEIKPQGEWKYDSGGMTIYDYSKQQAISEMNLLADSFHNYMIKVDKKDF